MAGKKNTDSGDAKSAVAPVRPCGQPFCRRWKEGSAFLVVVLLGVSVLSGLSLKSGVELFVAGEIATRDVTARQDLLVEEKESTQAKRDAVARAQPSVFRLRMEKAEGLEAKVAKIFSLLNEASESKLEQVRWQIAEYLNNEISQEALQVLRNNTMQNLVLIRVIPWLAAQLRKGVVLDSRILQRFDNGILVLDMATGVERLRLDLPAVLDIPRLEGSLDEFLRMDLQKPLRIRRSILEFVTPLIEPSLNYDAEATQARIREIMAAVEPVYYHIKKGEVIVRAGQRVDEQAQLKLQAIFNQEPNYFDAIPSMGVFLLSLLILASSMVSLKGKAFKPVGNRDALLLGCVTLLFTVIARLLAEIDAPLAEKLPHVTGEMFRYSFPVAGAVGLLALFLAPELCLFASLLLAFLCCRMAQGGLDMFIFYLLGSLLNIALIKRAQTRAEVLKSVLPLLGGLLLIWFGAGLSHFQGLKSLGAEALLVVFGGFLSLLIVFALSQIVELALGYTSRFRLMELMNLEQPLLRELMVTVPGTYHHSLIVANMVEAGARAIGANSLLCKVAALYHDIGKLKNPQYFIENQYGGKNPHDKLAPSMSALILIAHVKKGVELAQKHKLGQEIADLIQQHHGTAVINYFFTKAVEISLSKGGETVREEDYHYPGPKPQSREAGIIMLADAIEASSRTLPDPTPNRIRGHIHSMTKRIFIDGELDESDLTLKDLNLLNEAFHKILTGIFHQRIEYPSAPKEAARPAQKAEPAAIPACLAEPAPAPAETPSTDVAATEEPGIRFDDIQALKDSPALSRALRREKQRVNIVRGGERIH